MMIAVQGFMAGEYSIEDFQWKNRLILIGGSNADLVKQQSDTFRVQTKENEERKLLIFQWNSQKKAFYEPKKGFVLKEANFNNEFEVKLIGLDGSVKNKETAVINPQKVFDLIDSMPMRRQELKKRINSYQKFD